jgi:hypothetical protein
MQIRIARRSIFSLSRIPVLPLQCCPAVAPVPDNRFPTPA